jgi:CHASE3 domain sensor protein
MIYIQLIFLLELGSLQQVNDFIKNYANNIIEKAEKIKKVQELELAVKSIEPYMKK